MTLRVAPDDIVAESTDGRLASHPSWVRVRLGQIAEVINGAAFKSSFFNKERVGLPLIRIRDVGQSGAETFYAGDYDDRHVVEPGALLIGMDGDFRVARWNGPSALLNQRVCRVVLRDPGLYDESLLLYVMQGYLDAVHSRTSSLTVKHLSSRTVQALPLPLPPRKEQRRIVEAIEEQFSRLDEAELLIHRVGERTRRLRSSVLENISKDAQHSELGLVAGQMRYGTSVKCTYEGKGTPVLRIPNIRDQRVDRSDLKYARDPDADVTSALVQDGDLLFVRTNGSRDLIGKVAVVEQAQGEAFASYLIRVRPDRSRVEPRFLAAVLSAPTSRRLIQAKAATTAGQYNLNLPALRALPVPVPSLKQQRRALAEIDRALSIVEATEAAVDAALQRSATLRRAILNMAFRGTLVPQDPSDEPASVLLERIARKRASDQPKRAPQRVARRAGKR